MLVLKPADGTVSAGSLNVYTKDWSEVSGEDYGGSREASPSGVLVFGQASENRSLPWI